MLKEIPKEIEIRQLTVNIELRSDEQTNEEYLQGYAIKFESWSEVFGDWKEIISSTALDKTDLSDVRALINHNPDLILARNTAGNLILEVDGIGLKFKLKPSNTSYFRDLQENIKAGNINQCSFGFRINYENPNAEEWSKDEQSGLYTRRINDIAKITEISILSTPAYKATEVVIAKRGLDEYRTELEKHKKEEELRRKLLIELEL